MARQPTSSPRRRTALRPFAPGFTAEGSRAWIDRLKLEFPEHQLQVPAGRSLRSYLRQIGASDRPLTTPGGNNSSAFFVVHIRQSVHLIGGALIFRRLSDTRWSLKTVLEINPTRLFAHCDCDIGQLRAWEPCNYLEPAEEREAEISSETLDGNDNYFIDARVRRSVNLNRSEVNELAIRSATHFLETVLCPEEIPGAVIQSISVAPTMPRVSAMEQPIVLDLNWERWNIKQLECYWEFDVLDAVSTIHAFTRPTSEIAEDLQEIVYPHIQEVEPTNNERAEELVTFNELDEQLPEDIEISATLIDRPQNALSLTIPIRNDVRLVVYAKSSRRIRCEIRYLTNPRNMYGRQTAVRACPTNSFTNLVRLLPVLGNNAATITNLFLDALWQRVERPVGKVVQLSLLLSHMARACDQNNASMTSILSPLIAHGRVYKSGRAARIAAIDELIRRGVLIATKIRRRGNGREYAIARRYAEVLETVASNLRVW